jgi:hypothetical protein
VGALVGGALDGEERPGRHDLRPGLVAAAGVARQFAPGDGRWFVTPSATLGAVAASTRASGAADAGYRAADLRLGVIAGRTLGRLWNPYLLARGFGGPVWWSVDGEAVVGTDTRHVQLGAGVSVATSLGLTAVLDLSLFGEQGVSLGASWRL